MSVAMTVRCDNCKRKYITDVVKADENFCPTCREKKGKE